MLVRRLALAALLVALTAPATPAVSDFFAR
jgi:hypothetical protein